ncbi:hypothetical protein QZH41_002286 [Actinostola sp. cb2023]|nr:hypothetical protein QZH41_002286 [Actinostola sp. cb2023]
MCILKQGVKLMAYHGLMCGGTFLVHFSVSRRAEVAVRYRPVRGTQGKVAEVLKNGGEVDETKHDFFGVIVWILFFIHEILVILSRQLLSGFIQGLQNSIFLPSSTYSFLVDVFSKQMKEELQYERLFLRNPGYPSDDYTYDFTDDEYDIDVPRYPRGFRLSANADGKYVTIHFDRGYHQLTLAPESRYITTFATHTGLYRYKRLSFGINAAAEVFQHAISQLLADIPGALNISDDVIVFGQTQNDHDETLEKTLKKFSDNHLTLNAKKCEFNKTSLEFFGFVFSDGGMKPDPKKVEDIQNLEPPTNVKELRSVLGMTGYSSRFIPDYATITAPLRELTHKNSSWNWTTTHQEAFETLKEKLQSAPALAYFDISKSTEIAVDASPVGLGAILTQKDENGHSHVIAYGSRSLTKTEQNYSQTEREALAIVWGCEHYHLYCYGKALTVFTDHKPLTSIFNNPLSKPTPRIERWSLRLQPYQPNIVYAPGPDNPADYMSRHPKKQIEVNSREEKIAEEYINFVSPTCSTNCN